MKPSLGLCAECGAEFKNVEGKGRPRKWCPGCSPKFGGVGAWRILNPEKVAAYNERRRQARVIDTDRPKICVSCEGIFICVAGSTKRKCAECCRVSELQRDRTPARLAEKRSRHRLRVARREALRLADALVAAANLNPPLQIEAGTPPRRSASKWTPEFKRAYDREARRRKSGPRVWIAGPCAECGDPFVSQTTSTRFCGDACADRSRRRGAKHRRRVLLEAGPVDRIGLLSLARRDGWRCHICRRKVSKATWSIDHLVPVSERGAHVWENVALAHHRCNSIRSNRGGAQLRLAT